jgi:Peptidase family M48/Domain of unknown function (DUF5666)
MNHKKIALSFLLAVVFTVAIPNTISAAVKQVKIRGYITNIISPTVFEIDDVKVSRSETLIFNLENQDATVNFKPENIRVGTEIEVEGMLDDQTNELKAIKVSIDLDQFRKLKNTTVLSRTPEGIVKTEKGWNGVFWADGRQVRINETTQVLFELNKSEQKAVETAAKNSKKKAETEAADKDEFTDSEPLKDIADVKPGMFATFEGMQQPDGAILASRIVFVKNELEKGEGGLWKSMKITEKTPNFTAGEPGELKVSSVGKFKLLPNQQVQEYVQRIGQSLIPAYQKNLADDDPQKINFKFYVIRDKDANAFALANGAVVINSGMITKLENEAQLAAVIAHEISHATQEHTWRQINKDKNKRTALMVGSLAASIFAPGLGTMLDLINSAMVNGYSRRLEDQADRIGLEYMVAANYDPREAPRVWKIMSKKNGDMPNTFFWSSHNSNATRRSYLMVEIRDNYSQLDFSQMKKGDADEYQKISEATALAAIKKKK